MRNSFSPNRPRERGFTLLEIIIVVTVIGLLTGGVFIGMEMIRQSQIKSVMTDVNTYASAISQFKEKFSALPGDMPNATARWGANAGAGTDCTNFYFASNITSATSTCNGNGDDKIDGLVTNLGPEAIVLWRHLSNAEMVSGRFTGLGYNGFTQVFPGENIPVSKVDGTIFYVTHNTTLWGPGGGTYAYPWSNAKVHVISLGGAAPSNWPYLPVLTSSEAYDIDSKFDDGKPGLGAIKSPRPGSGSGWGDTCATNTDPNLGQYDMTLTNKVCSLFFEKVF